MLFIAQLEEQCAVAERHLSALEWDALGATWREQRRLTHGIRQALEEADWQADARLRAEIDARLRRIFGVRDAQLARLKGFHERVGERLTVISRFRSAARTIGKTRPKSRLGNLDTMQ